MNIYGIIILATLLVGFLLDIIADALNLRALRTELPDEFEDWADAETYKKSQRYTRARTRFGFLTMTVNLALLLAIWFSGAFEYLDRLVRQWDLHVIWRGLLYITILTVVKFLVALPFSIYSTFVIEERFGFNKTTPKTFVLDIVKGLLLAVLLGVPLLAGILAFLNYYEQWGWLYCWIAVTLFSLVIQFIAPRWIMPLFNKFRPLEEGELRQAIMSYADSVDFPLKNVFVIDGSRRSTKSNAFFTGFGKNKRIALYDTLVEQHTVPQIVSVVAHEIGHYRKKHILKMTCLSIVHTGLMFFLLSLFISHEPLFEAFYVEKVSVYVGLIFFGLLYTPIELILAVGLNWFSRKQEYEADRFVVDTCKQPRAFIKALKKLSIDNLSNLTPHPFYVWLNYSHPPVLKRIRAIRAKIPESTETADTEKAETKE